MVLRIASLVMVACTSLIFAFFTDVLPSVVCGDPEYIDNDGSTSSSTCSVIGKICHFEQSSFPFSILEQGVSKVP